MPIIRGISWPLFSGPTSLPEMSVGADVIRDSLISIVTTTLGERRMRPTFGMNSFDFVFEDITPITAARIARDTRKAIIENEPRVEIVSLNVGKNPDRSQPGFLVHIVYYANGEYGEADIPVAS